MKQNEPIAFENPGTFERGNGASRCSFPLWIAQGGGACNVHYGRLSMSTYVSFGSAKYMNHGREL